MLSLLVRKRTLRLSVVWATIVTLTSSVVCEVDVKRHETGLMLLLSDICEILAKCSQIVQHIEVRIFYS